MVWRGCMGRREGEMGRGRKREREGEKERERGEDFQINRIQSRISSKEFMMSLFMSHMHLKVSTFPPHWNIAAPDLNKIVHWLLLSSTFYFLLWPLTPHNPVLTVQWGQPPGHTLWPMMLLFLCLILPPNMTDLNPEWGERQTQWH